MLASDALETTQNLQNQDASAYGTMLESNQVGGIGGVPRIASSCLLFEGILSDKIGA